MIIIITFLELLGDILKKRPCLDKSRETLVVVDHAPKVGPERMDKLKTVLKKVLGRFGSIVSEYYPTDEKGIFKGYNNRTGIHLY